MKYAKNLRAEENDKRKDDPMNVDQRAGGNGSDTVSTNSGTNWDAKFDQLQAAIYAIKGKGKGMKAGGKGGPNTQCYNCWEYGHIAQNCPKGQHTPPGLHMPGQPKGGKDGKGWGEVKGKSKGKGTYPSYCYTCWEWGHTGKNCPKGKGKGKG